MEKLVPKPKPKSKSVVKSLGVMKNLQKAYEEEKQPNKYFDFEGQKLLKNKQFKYSALDVIWVHPETGAKVYVGDIEAATNMGILTKNKITGIVNCQGLETPNVFEKDANFAYFRFPIATHAEAPFPMGTKKGVLRFFYPFLSFVETQTNAGKNVLIHCLAGAHRAGTSGVAWLMYKDKLTVGDAIKKAK